MPSIHLTVEAENEQKREQGNRGNYEQQSGGKWGKEQSNGYERRNENMRGEWREWQYITATKVFFVQCQWSACNCLWAPQCVCVWVCVCVCVCVSEWLGGVTSLTAELFEFAASEERKVLQVFHTGISTSWCRWLLCTAVERVFFCFVFFSFTLSMSYVCCECVCHHTFQRSA